MASYKKDKWVTVGSGVVCKDASMMGSRQGCGGPAMVGQTVWMEELAFTTPTITFTECVPDWEANVAALALPSSRVMTCILNPAMLGDKYHRTRRMTTSLDPDVT